ncbi:MAG: hypothetical protein KDA58_15935, partial [Planctomycetaceae bacterium]|nr:hypothetical protein [Planctomycetaceae bacterium]
MTTQPFHTLFAMLSTPRARRILWLIASLLTGLSWLAMNDADPDLWGHVLYGQEALEHGLETKSSWNYTAIGYRWINHENLAELALAFADQVGGAAGLLALKSGLALLMLGTVIWRLQARSIHPWTIGAIVMVLAQTLAFHWHFRPQIFGYVLFTIAIALLDYSFAGWSGEWWLRRPPSASDSEGTVSSPEYSWFRMRQLWWLIPLSALWTNTHGSFAAGVCVLVAYLGLRAIESLCIWGSAGWGRFRRFSLMAFGIAIATLLTPYGPKLQLWMLSALGVPRPEIADWQPLPLWTSEAAGFWLIVISTLFASAKTSKFDFTHAVLMLLLSWQGVAHIRHLAWL